MAMKVGFSNVTLLSSSLLTANVHSLEPQDNWEPDGKDRVRIVTNLAEPTLIIAYGTCKR